MFRRTSNSIFDNCSYHIDEELLQILTNHRILVITYPLHTSHLFQVLDRLLFGVMKNNKNYIPDNDDIQSTLQHLYKTFKAYELSTCSLNIHASFRHIGFEYHKKNDVFYLRLNRQKVEFFDEFKEIWE